jgi:heme O synthase-like polyprenyltransferase
MLAREQSLASARRLFWFSNYYLALLFAVMVVDHLMR